MASTNTKMKWNGLSDEMRPVDPGVYNVFVERLDSTVTKAGDPMLRLKVKIADDGPFQGRALFATFLQNQEVSRQIFARVCQICDVAVTEDGFDAREFEGKLIRVSVKHRVDTVNDQIRADIERFFPAE